MRRSNRSSTLPVQLPSTPDPFSDDNGPPSPAETLPDYVTEINVPSGTLTSFRPPSYVPSRPNQPQIYTFTAWSTDVMMLMPPASATERSPLYRINVRLNLLPFTPLSYVTTVRRGGDVDGPVIGEFEIGITHPRAIVTIGEYTTRASSILTSLGGDHQLSRWKRPGVDIRWDCRNKLKDGSHMCVCYHTATKAQLASMIPPPLNGTPPIPDATLTVFPDGHALFDDILLSALIIERQLTMSV